MKYGSGYKAKIEFRDLVFHILRRWRSILLLSVLFYLLWGNHEIFCITLYAAGGGEEGRKAAAPAGEQVVPAVAQVRQEAAEKQELPKTDESERKEAEPQERSAPERKKTIKCYTMNFAAWLFLAVSARGVVYVLEDRMRGESELRKRYGYRLLGVVPAPGKRRFLSCIDRMIRRLEECGKEIGREEAFDVAAANIRNLTGRSRRLLLTGTLEKQRLQEIAEKLSPKLADAVLTVGGRMGSEPASLRLLADCEEVILVEEKDRSPRAKIQREQEMIEAMKKKVAGYIFLR